jgi:hypothetical protein
VLPRLTVFPARAAPVAVLLFRRRRWEYFCLRLHYGKSRGRPAEALELGSRFTGRVHASVCDLAPDGRHFIYSVLAGTRQEQYARRHYAWTALCHPPWFTALFLLPHRDSWGGGGTFYGAGDVLINNGAYDCSEDYAPMQGRSVGGVRLHFSNLTQEAARMQLRAKAIPDGWTGEGELLFGMPALRRRTSGPIRITAQRAARRTSPRIQPLYDYSFSDAADAADAAAATQDVTWADFDFYGRLWLARGDVLEIHRRPRVGVLDTPDVSFDIAAIVDAAHPPRQPRKARISA